MKSLADATFWFWLHQFDFHYIASLYASDYDSDYDSVAGENRPLIEVSAEICRFILQ